LNVWPTLTYSSHLFTTMAYPKLRELHPTMPSKLLVAIHEWFKDNARPQNDITTRTSPWKQMTFATSKDGMFRWYRTKPSAVACAIQWAFAISDDNTVMLIQLRLLAAFARLKSSDRRYSTVPITF
jgi:hypothetical protein